VTGKDIDGQKTDRFEKSQTDEISAQAGAADGPRAAGIRGDGVAQRHRRRDEGRHPLGFPAA
jgi:hypothetical protein